MGNQRTYTVLNGVSATLRNLLSDRMEYRKTDAKEAEAVPVTIAPPDVQTGAGEGARVNLFLYRVTENPHLKNQEMLLASGSGIPMLSLDLHYLLTAFGDGEDSDSEAQTILGDAMRVLHDYSLITEGLYKIHNNLPAGLQKSILDDSLRGQFENVKIYPDPMSLEDLIKIWTALVKPYRLSVAYKVSVIQIESQRPKRLPIPVGALPSGGPRIYASSFKRPWIEELRVIIKGDPGRQRTAPYAGIGDTLVVCGGKFPARSRVFLGSVEAEAMTGPEDRILVPIPDHEDLQPGPKTLRVVVDLMMGEPAMEHSALQSNMAVFMLVPKIDDLLLTTLSPNKRRLQITGERLFDSQKEGACMTIIGDAVTQSIAYDPKTPKKIAFDLPASLMMGEYFVRVSVNGVEGLAERALVIP
ncbi:MAG: DUF4255 domain-containing protein [Methanothrix sp.]|nr:DUF4255 domain-containing protein [Methanothrix sp.]